MFNREMCVANCEALKAEADKCIKEYNEFFAEAKFSEASKALNDATEAVNKYTANARAIAFDKIMEANDPLAEACRQYVFDSIAIKDVKQQGSVLAVKRVEETEKVISLEALQRFAKDTKGVKIGADEEWLDAIHHLNYLMTIQTAESLGIDPSEIRDCYRIKDVAKEYKLGIAHAADGATQTLAAINKIVGMMLKNETHYDPAGRHEVTYLNRVYSKKGRKCLSVTVASHKQMVQIIMEICHKLLTGTAYSVDYKRAKGK